MENSPYPRPALTADVVAVRQAHPPELLLVKRRHDPFAGRWALPGGFVDEWERPEDAARRELAEETGLAPAGPLRLVGVYGDQGRDPRGWTVSVAYLALVDSQESVRAGDDAHAVAWFPIDALPALAFDHDRIVADALRALGQ